MEACAGLSPGLHDKRGDLGMWPDTVCEPVPNVAYLGPPPGLQDTALETLKTWSKPEPEITGCPEVTGHPWFQWDHWDTRLRTLGLDGK